MHSRRGSKLKARHYTFVRHYSFFIRGVSKIPYYGPKIRRRYNLGRHRKIIRILTPLFDEVLQDTHLNLEDRKTIDWSYQDTVWFFWWQGKEQITGLSQKCYKSLLRNKGKRKVIFINKHNYKDYTNLPDYIIEKFEAGLITKTHFSDIIRFNLLSNHGGLWVDATVYFTDNLDVFNTGKLVTCSGYPDELRYNIAFGRWTSFFIGGPRSLSIFSFMNNFFMKYWKQNNYLIDYFLVDYALHYAWEKDLSSFKEICQENNGLQPHLFDLEQKLGDKYDQAEWNLLTQNTSVFKLSNKLQFDRSEGTFYSNL